MSFFWEIGVYLIQAIFQIGIGYATENQDDTDVSELSLSFWLILGAVLLVSFGIMAFLAFA